MSGGFIEDSRRTTIAYDIRHTVAPMPDEFGSLFRPDRVEVVVANRQAIEMMFTGDRCTKAGLPLALTQEQKDDPRHTTYTSITFDFAYLNGDRSIWPAVVDELMRQLRAQELWKS